MNEERRPNEARLKDTYGERFPRAFDEETAVEDKLQELNKLFGEKDKTLRAWAYFQASLALRFYGENLKHSDCRKAVDYLRKAMEPPFSEWPEANLNLAVALSKLDRTKESLDHYEKATMYFRAGGADPEKHHEDAALLGKIWLFRAYERAKLEEPADLIKARSEFEKGMETLKRHPGDATCRRWLAFADEVEVELRTAERLQGLSG